MQNVKLRLQRLKNEAAERKKQLSNSKEFDRSCSLSSGSNNKPSADEIKKECFSEQCQTANLEASPAAADLPAKAATAEVPPMPLTSLSTGQFLTRNQPTLPSVSSCSFEATKMPNRTKKWEELREEKQSVDRGKGDSVVQLPIPNRSISGTQLSVNGKAYTLLGLIGKGGSSRVYQAHSEWHQRCVAIKYVDLSNADMELKKAYENETDLLIQLQDSPNVIRLFDHEKRENEMFIVMECGDIDLATFMQKKSKEMDANFIKYHWHELLKCVKAIHDKKIVHSDLKPANFLFVGASLKLIDFGIASKIPSNKTSVVKEVQVGTLNYMSPEAIVGSYTDENGVPVYKVPLKSDVWSLGCILYTMVYGHTPFQHLKNQMAKISAISSDRHPIEFKRLRDPDLADVLKKCLVRNVRERATIDELLEHQYLKDSLLATPSPRVVPLSGRLMPLITTQNDKKSRKGTS